MDLQAYLLLNVATGTRFCHSHPSISHRLNTDHLLTQDRSASRSATNRGITSDCLSTFLVLPSQNSCLRCHHHEVRLLSHLPVGWSRYIWSRKAKLRQGEMLRCRERMRHDIRRVSHIDPYSYTAKCCSVHVVAETDQYTDVGPSAPRASWTCLRSQCRSAHPKSIMQCPRV